MTARLNARIDAALARKVKYLCERTRKTTTEVLKASIEAYFEQVSRAGGAAELLADFVASGAGEASLSSDYKAHLTRSLSRKVRR